MKKKQGQRKVSSHSSVLGGQLGMTLIEVLIALGILVVVASIFLLGLSISSKGVVVSQEQVTADSLAKSQTESVKSWAYDDVNNPPDYQAAKLTDIPSGYDIAIAAERLDPKGDGIQNDDGIQKITVTVTRAGETAFTLVGYKVNR